MFRWNAPGVVVVGIALLGCGADDKQCTLELRWGLSVSVVDPQNNLVCDVTVRIKDGAYEEAGVDHGTCVFHGAAERPGTYDVSALRDDVVLAEKTQIVVPAGECHVQGQNVTLVVAE